MPALLPKPKSRPAPALPDQHEQPFWRLAGASWRQLAGGFTESGFSLEWHEWNALDPLAWDQSFHPQSVEICLNLEGDGWVEAIGTRMNFRRDTVGFFINRGQRVTAQRDAGQKHKFLSVEFRISFLAQHLGSYAAHLHPLIGKCVRGETEGSAVSGSGPLTHRHRDLLNSLLHPPVLASAQRLWYQVKALEFATEFFFGARDGETLCTRAQRLAAERVARAKEILFKSLADPPALEQLGQQVGCSHFYLSRTFTRETGLTISQWLRQARLERAAELLRSRRCNVTEAALEVGYSSLSHFSEAFHQMFGCCPGLYPLATPTQRGAVNREPGVGQQP